MKKIVVTIKTLALSILSSCVGTVKSNPDPGMNLANSNNSIYSFKLKALDGTILDFSKYKGKKILIVNVASKCGFTSQYEDLQKLNDQYGKKVAIVGFPANNFGSQEPGSNEEIGAFCKKNYGVSFQMMSKVSVKGDDISPIYKWLTDKSQNGWNDKAPTWNFCKYLINEKGELLHFYGSSINPMSKEIIDAINS